MAKKPIIILNIINRKKRKEKKKKDNTKKTQISEISHKSNEEESQIIKKLNQLITCYFKLSNILLKYFNQEKLKNKYI